MSDSFFGPTHYCFLSGTRAGSLLLSISWIVGRIPSEIKRSGESEPDIFFPALDCVDESAMRNVLIEYPSSRRSNSKVLLLLAVSGLHRRTIVTKIHPAQHPLHYTILRTYNTVAATPSAYRSRSRHSVHGTGATKTEPAFKKKKGSLQPPFCFPFSSFK